MNRKISHIALTLLLVILTVGFSVSKQYCGAALVKISLFDQGTGAGEAHGDCGMAGCCHNEQQTFHLDETYTTPVVHDSVDFFQVLLSVIDLGLLTPVIPLPVVSGVLSLAESPSVPGISAVLSYLQVYRL